MADDKLIELSRDVSATWIPSGTPVTLKKGERVMITQSLGGSYTVVINGNMVRIEGKDADAIGKPVIAAQPELPSDPKAPVDRQKVWDQMKTCYDPEIPVNIVDLGLVYDCDIKPLDKGGSRIEVKMTLTAPGCGMGETIRRDVESKIKTLPGVSEVDVQLVWEPQWNQSMMSEAAKLQLGLM
jgi:probable FeS assembly SUF system protein SufT